MAKKTVIGQLGLFRPDSDWRPPSELPDLRGRPIVAIDTETRDDGLAAHKGPGWALGPAGYLCGVSYAADGVKGYIPVAHPESENFPLDNVIRWVSDLFASGTRIVFHNGPYDIGWLGSYGVPDPVSIDDTSAAAVMLDETYRSYTLDACLAREGLPLKTKDLLNDAARAYGGDPAKAAAYLYLMPSKFVGPYAEDDAARTLDLWQRYEPQLKAQGIWNAYRLEMDLIPIVVAMRRRGIRVDLDRAEQVAAAMRLNVERLCDIATNQLVNRRRVTIQDLRSPQWLATAFANEGLRFPRTAKTGQGSFSKEWMQKSEHWLPRLVVEARSYEDAASKFVDGFIMSFAHRGRLHAEVHQFLTDDGGTRSQRFSYSNPPLQQMPRVAEGPDDGPLAAGENPWEFFGGIGGAIRGLFHPEKGEAWGAFDYCHDDKTEVLTDRGWMLFKDLDRTEKIAQRNPDGSISFVTPSDWYVGEDREREMIRLSGARGTDALVTPEHEMIVISDEKEHRILAGDLPSVMNSTQLPLEEWVYLGSKNENFSRLRLIAALQADAACRTGTWRFRLSKQRKLDRLFALLNECGIPYRTLSGTSKSGKTTVTIDHEEWIEEYLSVPGKKFVFETLRECSYQNRVVFLMELGYWDGSYENEHKCKYGSTDSDNVRTVAALAAISGVHCRQRSGAWSVTTEKQRLGRKPFFSVSLFFRGPERGEVITVERVQYSGRVYCVTVPSHVIMTRRSGNVLTSMQSQQEPRITVHFAAATSCSGVDDALRRYNENPRTDYHRMVADMTGFPRPRAKILNLAMTYGRGARTTAEELGVSLDEGKRIIEEYHSRLPYIRPLEELCRNRANSRGYIRLIDGARMHYNEWDGGWLDNDVRADALMRGKRLEPCRIEEARQRASDPDHPWHGRRLRRADTRKALNNLVQGSAARQTKKAIVDVHRAGYLPLIQMHDEIGVSVSSGEQVREVHDIVRDAIPLRVPVVVDAEIGRTWGEAKYSWEEYEKKFL